MISLLYNIIFINKVNKAAQQSFSFSGKCSGVWSSWCKRWNLKSRVWFNGIHDSYFSILIDCLFLLFWFTHFYYKQLEYGAHSHTLSHTYMNSRLVPKNQGLLGLNTNVTVSRNLYWSTLSALIAWPRLGWGPTRCDWIWKVPIQVVPTGYLGSTVQQHQHYTARRKVSRIWSVPLYLRLHCPQLIRCGWGWGAGSVCVGENVRCEETWHTMGS